jgi:hypothetical protein
MPLPKGWASRTIKVRNSNTRNHTGLCLEAHDLAASKLAAFRDKDREFVRACLANDMISGRKLVSRLRGLALGAAEVDQRLRGSIPRSAISEPVSSSARKANPACNCSCKRGLELSIYGPGKS